VVFTQQNSCMPEHGLKMCCIEILNNKTLIVICIPTMCDSAGCVPVIPIKNVYSCSRGGIA